MHMQWRVLAVCLATLGRASATPSLPPTCGNTKSGVNCPGNDIRSQQAPSAQACCGFCLNTTGYAYSVTHHTHHTHCTPTTRAHHGAAMGVQWGSLHPHMLRAAGLCLFYFWHPACLLACLPIKQARNSKLGQARVPTVLCILT